MKGHKEWRISRARFRIGLRSSTRHEIARALGRLGRQAKEMAEKERQEAKRVAAAYDAHIARLAAKLRAKKQAALETVAKQHESERQRAAA